MAADINLCIIGHMLKSYWELIMSNAKRNALVVHTRSATFWLNLSWTLGGAGVAVIVFGWALGMTHLYVIGTVIVSSGIGASVVGNRISNRVKKRLREIGITCVG